MSAYDLRIAPHPAPPRPTMTQRRLDSHSQPMARSRGLELAISLLLLLNSEAFSVFTGMRIIFRTKPVQCACLRASLPFQVLAEAAEQFSAIMRNDALCWTKRIRRGDLIFVLDPLTSPLAVGNKAL